MWTVGVCGFVLVMAVFIVVEVVRVERMVKQYRKGSPQSRAHRYYDYDAPDDEQDIPGNMLYLLDDMDD